ncbi:MAG: transposase [Chthoniobacterales bacterium]
MILARHPRVRIHYTPTYSSWLNQVETWYAKIQRDIIARGSFSSLKDLDRKIIRYIRSSPFRWLLSER